MITITKTLNYSPKSKSEEAFWGTDTLLFDIETTGFSARNNHIYLIGCMCRDETTITIRQFFAENREDEKNILDAFFSMVREFRVTISFNGLGFDLPFLQERSLFHHLSSPLSEMTHVDLYKLLRPLQHILNLSSLKQKSLEEFLGIHRKDPFSGGELIRQYHTYEKEKSQILFEQMILHNYEDVLGMLDLLPLLSYVELFEGKFTVMDHSLQNYQKFDGETALELLFFLKPDFSLPKRISYQKDDLYLWGNEDVVKINVKVYQGELKYFYPNYKDYYYLPQEDMAIHKSVASYVDRTFRTRAKASNCYTKKSGCFLPQYGECISPCLKQDYHDKWTYFEMTDAFLSDLSKQQQYMYHIIKILGKLS